MGRPRFSGLEFLSMQNSSYVQFAIATPVVLWAGWPFRGRPRPAIGACLRNLNMFTLIALGTGVAWAFSVVAGCLRDTSQPAFRDHHGAVAVYFEAAAVITVLVLLGQVLELTAREHTSGAIRALLDLASRLKPRDGTRPRCARNSQTST